MRICYKIALCLAFLPNITHASAPVGDFYYSAGCSYDANDQNSMEEAFDSLWKAYALVDSHKKDKVAQRIHRLDKEYNKWVSKHLPLFFDIPDSRKEKFYSIRAQYQDARGLRQYGELLLENGDYEEGWKYLESAANKNEPRALFLVAERYAYALGGVNRDLHKAFKLMMKSSEMGYIPAFRMLSKIYWDGAWGQASNHVLATSYLLISITKFSEWEMGDKAVQENLSGIINQLKWVLKCMKFFKDNPFQGFRPSFDAMLITWYDPEYEGNLRAMAHYICKELETYPGPYLTTNLPYLVLSNVEIRIKKLKGYSGLCTHKADDYTYSFMIAIDDAFYLKPPHKNEEYRAWWWKIFNRQMYIVETLAHELAHGYFASRYPYIAKFSEADLKLTYEGHATTVAYRLISYFYYCGNLSRDQYANNFLSEEYKRYFNWFNNPQSKCLSPSGLLINNTLDSWEEATGGDENEARTRKLVPMNDNTYWKPQFFGKAFYGCM